MDWIILNLITNKRNNILIYGFILVIIILDFINDRIGFINEKYIIIDFSLFAIGLLIVKEILNYWYKKLYNKNKNILDEINQLSQTGNYSKIIDEAKLIKIIKPQLLEKTYWIGFANLYLSNPQKALNEFDSIESDYKNSSIFFYHKALALLDSENIEKSIEYFTSSIELEETWQSFDQRGVAYIKLDKLNEAENDFRKSIELKADSSNTCNLGIVLEKKGQHKEALEFYNRSINIQSNNANAFYNRALVNYYLGNYHNSILDNTKAINIEPKRHRAYYNRAISKQKINELESAIKDFDKVEELAGDNNQIYLNRGYCKCKLGNIASGLIDLKKAKELDCKDANELIEKYSK